MLVDFTTRVNFVNDAVWQHNFHFYVAKVEEENGRCEIFDIVENVCFFFN